MSSIFCFCLLSAMLCLAEAGKACWRQADVKCAPENSSTAIRTFTAPSEDLCVLMIPQDLKGALVAQFDRLSRACSVFDFQSVCRSLTAGRSPSCAVFFRFPINHRSISPKLNNVWLADDVSRLENVVCQADRDTNRLHPVGVEWSSEGAVFDGKAAYAVLNKSSISFATGLTWLLRIKRQPQIQPLLDFINCDAITTSTVFGIFIFEYNAPGRLFIRAHAINGFLLPHVYSPYSAMPSSSDSWINVGFTAAGGSFDVFLNGSFLPKSSLSVPADRDHCTVTNGKICLYLGMRVGAEKFKGTVRALALASSSMSETEIRDFFDLVD